MSNLKSVSTDNVRVEVFSEVDESNVSSSNKSLLIDVDLPATLSDDETFRNEMIIEIAKLVEAKYEEQQKKAIKNAMSSGVSPMALAKMVVDSYVKENAKNLSDEEFVKVEAPVITLKHDDKKADEYEDPYFQDGHPLKGAGLDIKGLAERIVELSPSLKYSEILHILFRMMRNDFVEAPELNMLAEMSIPSYFILRKRTGMTATEVRRAIVKNRISVLNFLDAVMEHLGEKPQCLGCDEDHWSSEGGTWAWIGDSGAEEKIYPVNQINDLFNKSLNKEVPEEWTHAGSVLEAVEGLVEKQKTLADEWGDVTIEMLPDGGRLVVLTCQEDKDFTDCE